MAWGVRLGRSCACVASCPLLSSVSPAGLICLLSWGDKARRNLHFKSQRMLSAEKGGWNQDGKAGRCLWRWVRTWQPSRSCLPPGNCLEPVKRLVLCCPGVFQSILLGALRYSCWASLAFQHQFWLWLILSWSYGGSLRGGWMWHSSLRITRSFAAHTCASPLPTCWILPQGRDGWSLGVTWMQSLNSTLVVHGSSTLGLGPERRWPFPQQPPASISYFPPLDEKKTENLWSLFFGHLLKTNKNPFIAYLFGLKISKTTKWKTNNFC